MRRRGCALLVLLLAAALDCRHCQSDEAVRELSLSEEVERVSPDLARLLTVPCGGYAHVFRRDRHGERELLAALRVSRVQACATDSVFGVQCGCAADAQDEEADWDVRVERLQVRSCVVVRHNTEETLKLPSSFQTLLHVQCQQAAIHASQSDNMARSGATRMVTSAVRPTSKDSALLDCSLTPRAHADSRGG